MPTPKLRNPEWQSALDAATPQLEKFQQRLNQLSEDIRAIEKYLIDSGFRIDTRVIVAGRTAIDEWLGWASAKDTWRLVYIYSDESGEVTYLKPLIETDVATRWRVSQAMPELLTAIATAAL